MQKRLLLSHSSTWLCLLGSTLALAAFFLPSYELPSGSLWNLLVHLIHQEPQTTITISLASFILLPLLLSTEALACLAVFFNPSRRTGMIWYQILIIPTMFCALAATVFAPFLDLLAAQLSNPPSAIINPNHIGTWLLLSGLILALLGSAFAPSGKSAIKPS